MSTSLTHPQSVSVYRGALNFHAASCVNIFAGDYRSFYRELFRIHFRRSNVAKDQYELFYPADLGICLQDVW